MSLATPTKKRGFDRKIEAAGKILRLFYFLLAEVHCMSIRREMGEVNYFKNFNMGREIEIAGEFIYESMREMYSLKSFSDHFKINKILYNGAVGIERLQKILLCMFLINQTKDFDDLPKSLKEHKHIALHELIKKYINKFMSLNLKVTKSNC